MTKNSVLLQLNQMPLVMVADRIFAKKPFLHTDRTADFHVLIYVLKGRISVIEGREEHHVSAGKLLLLKAGIRHYGVTFSAPDTEWIYVHFLLEQPEQPIMEFQPYTSHLQEQIFSDKDYAYTLELPKMSDIGKGSVTDRKLRNLVGIFHSKGPLRAGYMNPLFVEILLDCYQSVKEEADVQNTDKVYEIIQYLENHTRENFDTALLEEQFHLSYKHIGRFFKAATGRTLLEYHTKLRMNEAARLLRESTEQISVISRDMGYPDPFYFSNVFRKWMGVSPKFYREQYIRKGYGAIYEED
ncbi:MAG TPA: AraC family transcriptional regulator [Lachnospiraceae bacterium]|nr:AraC family transcriptional regulator [Lachnospiraceae bacterium]